MSTAIGFGAARAAFGLSAAPPAQRESPADTAGARGESAVVSSLVANQKMQVAPAARSEGSSDQPSQDADPNGVVVHSGFDPRRAIDDQERAIDQLLERYEEVQTRIDAYIRSQMPRGPEAEGDLLADPMAVGTRQPLPADQVSGHLDRLL